MDPIEQMPAGRAGRPGSSLPSKIDLDTFAACIRDHYSDWIRLACSVVRTQADAEDAVQQGLLKAWRNLAQFEGRAELRTWIASIVRNEALCLLRSRRRAKTDLIGSKTPLWNMGEEEFRDHRKDPEAECLAMETDEILRKHVAGTPAIFRKVLVLHHLNELELAAAARGLGLSNSAVKSRLRRARLLLAERLAAFFRPAA